MSTLTPRVHAQHIRPPPRLFSAGALYEGDAFWRRDGQAVRMTSHGVRFAHFQDRCHVHAGLRDRVRMFVQRVCELPIVVQDEPPPLPSLCSVERIGEVPAWCNEQIPAFGYLSTCPIRFQGFSTMLLFLSEAISALALIEDVWCKFPAIRSPRHVSQRSGSSQRSLCHRAQHGGTVKHSH